MATPSGQLKGDGNTSEGLKRAKQNLQRVLARRSVPHTQHECAHTYIRSLKPAQIHRVVTEANTVRASMDAHNPLHNLLLPHNDMAATDFIYNCGIVPVKPVPNALMYTAGFYKDRENRRNFPAWYNPKGQWIFWSATAECNSAKKWAFWKDYLGEELPWPITHAFPKCCITGMAFIKPPLVEEEDLSLWVDTRWGEQAWIIEKLLKFDAPIYGIDNPQGPETKVAALNQRERLAHQVKMRLQRGDYNLIWTGLDRLSLAMPLANAYRRKARGAVQAGLDPHDIEDRPFLIAEIKSCKENNLCLSMWCSRCNGVWCTCISCTQRRTKHGAPMQI